MIDTIDTTLSVTCPVKLIKICQPQNDWMTPDLVAQTKYKDDLMIEARRTNLESDWIKAKKEKNQTKLLINQAKCTHMQKSLTKHKNNSKAFRKTIHEILPKNNASSNNINVLDNDGSAIPADLAASHINTFFTNIASKLDTTNTPWQTH